MIQTTDEQTVVGLVDRGSKTISTKVLLILLGLLEFIVLGSI